MAFQIKRNFVFQIYLCLDMIMMDQSSKIDIHRLNSIKNVLADPFNDKPNYFYQTFEGGLIVGFVFSLICYFMFVCMFHSCVQFKKKKYNHLNNAKELGKYICSITRWRTHIVINQMHEFIHPWLVYRKTKEISILFEELYNATDCFAIDSAIGVGKMGMMYQGNLPNGQLLAVKRLSNSHLFKRQFLSETMIMGKYEHKNIVPLLGFCIEGNEKLLAYPYMSNGRLSKWLHPLKSEVVRLKWPQRANIALGIARGLSWLHHTCDLHIVHMNIRSQSILLDENFEPKISNFGDAKFMNPNIQDGLRIIFKVNNGKKDVYDFGSVLFELITGETYNELTRSSTNTNICGNPSHFYNAIEKSLIREGFENEVCTLLKIACECVHPLPNQRPTMLEVYNNMSNVKKRGHGCNDDSSITIGEIVRL